MASPELPPFEPPSLAELRRIYATTTDPDVRRAVLELVRCRKVLAEADGHFQAIFKAWNANGGGHLVALHLLKKLLFQERFRVPLP